MVNQQVLDLVQEQVKRLKQSVDNAAGQVKQQTKTSSNNENSSISNNDLPNDTKELQDQVRHFHIAIFIQETKNILLMCLDYQTSFIVNNKT